MYDFVIVGSGWYGAVFAHQARQAGRRVLVLEKRNHIGGNCYTSDFEDTDINVHRYGTHIFHTNHAGIWSFVNRFSVFNRYQHRVLTTHRNRVYTMPINLGTINAFYSVNLTPGEVAAFLDGKRGHIPNPANLEEKAINLVGHDLYEAFVKGYTIKQWGCDPKELPASVVSRLPVRDSYDDSYFSDRFQGIPVNGYTPIFEKLLEGASVETSVDFFDDRDRWLRQCHRLVYTGPVDRFFDYEFGRLNWRSVRFEPEHLDLNDYQGTSVMNFADVEVPQTRIHEPKHLHPERNYRARSTVIMREYAHRDDDAPYYPVDSARDRLVLAKYKARQREAANVIFGGRLAEYRYYDMHQVIGAALQAAQRTLANGLRKAA